MATNIISGQAAAAPQVSLPDQLVPTGGPRAVGFTLDFVNFTSNIVDFTYAYENTNLKEVYGVFVDNSVNPQTLTIAANQAPFESIVVPPYSQGTFPIIAPIRPKFTLTSGGNCLVGVIFLNIPLALCVWSVQTPGTPTAPTNKSVVTAGVAVNPWGTKHVTAGGFIYNPTSNGAVKIYVDMINSADNASPGANGTTIDLSPGDSIPIPNGYITVTVNATINATPFVAFGMGVV
jgi:hypothetical protein